MIISKRDTSDIFNGCLSYLKETITSEFSEGESWAGIGITGLVGSPTQYNTHNSPGTHQNVSLQIFLGGKYILPCAYSLMGRRDPTYKDSYLKGWVFYGRNKNNVWINLSSYSNKAFSFGEKRTFLLNSSESYNAFMLKMTETNTDNNWYLCLGQIEVYGDIYSKPHSYDWKKCTSVNGFHNSKLFLIFIFIYSYT